MKNQFKSKKGENSISELKMPTPLSASQDMAIAIDQFTGEKIEIKLPIAVLMKAIFEERDEDIRSKHWKNFIKKFPEVAIHCIHPDYRLEFNVQ